MRTDQVIRENPASELVYYSLAVRVRGDGGGGGKTTRVACRSRRLQWHGCQNYSPRAPCSRFSRRCTHRWRPRLRLPQSAVARDYHVAREDRDSFLKARVRARHYSSAQSLHVLDPAPRASPPCACPARQYYHPSTTTPARCLAARRVVIFHHCAHTGAPPDEPIAAARRAPNGASASGASHDDEVVILIVGRGGRVACGGVVGRRVADGEGGQRPSEDLGAARAQLVKVARRAAQEAWLGLGLGLGLGSGLALTLTLTLTLNPTLTLTSGW